MTVDSWDMLSAMQHALYEPSDIIGRAQKLEPSSGWHSTAWRLINVIEGNSATT